MLAMNLNLKGKALTQFTNMSFNSFCNFGGKQLAANSSGLFELTGTQDVETDIDAYFETPLSDWGISSIKRPRFCYLSYYSNADLEMILVNGDGTEMSKIDVSSQSTTLPQVIKFSVPRTVAHRYWKFKIASNDGASFKINALEVFFVVRPSGLSQGT